MGLSDQLATGLRTRRAELGLTLREVAMEAGVSLPYVANLEKGRGNPTLDVVEALAAALDVTVMTLLQTESEPSGRAEPMPAAVIRYARTRQFQVVSSRIARRQRIPVEEARRRILVAMAAAPRARGRPLSQVDCRRLIDVFTLIVTEPNDPA